MRPHEKLNETDTLGNFDTDQDNKFLIYTLGQELYGSRLLDIKEVIKLNAVKSVPYMVHYFKGVINLRGQIVSVIDLREKFGIPLNDLGLGLVLVVEAKEGLIGAIVDDLVSVESIGPQDIDANPAIETKIPAQFLMGIGKQRDRLINLIRISSCLSVEEMRVITKKGPNGPGEEI